MSECYVNVCGGIGNQLFQMAAGYTYAKKYDKKLIINPNNWSAGQGNHPNTYKDNIFKNFEYGAPITRDVVDIHEEPFNYSELPFHHGSVSLNGYLQSLKYFKEVKDEFISMLVLPDVHIPKFMSRPTYIAFHIRRGDYLKYPNIHYICDTKYFKYFFDLFGPPIANHNRILVFTDSVEHVKREFSEYAFDIVDETELKVFSCMSKCDIIIGSNSTFSWWASLIGGKSCYFPSKWFGDGREHKDIFREDMILHDV